MCVGTGGCLGAAMGCLMISLVSDFLIDVLHRINAVKNVLSTLINAMAAIVFVLAAHVAWAAAALIAASSVVGGLVGAAVGRRLPSGVLRGVIVVAGLIAVVKLLAA